MTAARSLACDAVTVTARLAAIRRALASTRAPHWNAATIPMQGTPGLMGVEAVTVRRCCGCGAMVGLTVREPLPSGWVPLRGGRLCVCGTCARVYGDGGPPPDAAAP